MSLLHHEEYQDALADWTEAKDKETHYNQMRLNAEKKILAIKEVAEEVSAKNSGTIHFQGGLIVKTGLIDTWDNDFLNMSELVFNSMLIDFPFKRTWKPNNPEIKRIREDEPALYQDYILPALTVKAMKPGFSIKGFK
ncbi:hypothetical protein UFOVP1454_29 [uncultured Caudovirales phage]|uniref:Uncharacterized protein n=1 Tax=uncultured Caudovirales phage TaxID=2100421 RepID=A0A6J5SIZ5_9CAUD|nr:hypothetical protein UFOVP1454_29 [uncultured Caudovirales phage]